VLGFRVKDWTVRFAALEAISRDNYMDCSDEALGVCEALPINFEVVCAPNPFELRVSRELVSVA
jgi:hypothetical protein